MSINIESLRKMRNADFSSITAEMEKIVNPPSQNSSSADNRIWKLTRDKAGNGSALIRFLPKLEGDDLPWVKLYTHGFQGPTGKWYIENSLTTINEEDPVSIDNSRLWNTGNEADKELARNRKRRLEYFSNIIVLEDPANPENNGKVFLFKFGKKIMDKIMDKFNPTFADDPKVNVFDLWEGANFKLRIRTVDGYPNYDQSIFADPSELLNGDETKLIEVVNQQHKLSEFLDRKNFKSFEELSRKFQSVTNPDAPVVPNANTMTNSYAETPIKPQSTSNYTSSSTPATSPASNDDDADIMDYFKRIAEAG
jgi:hypothetical protein